MDWLSGGQVSGIRRKPGYRGSGRDGRGDARENQNIGVEQTVIPSEYTFKNS
jgi:hypothetical protein